MLQIRQAWHRHWPIATAAALAVITLAIAVAALATRPSPDVTTGPDATSVPSATATVLAQTASPEPLPPPSPIPEAPLVTAMPPPAEPPVAAVVADPVAAAATRAPRTPTPSPDPKVWRVEGVVVDPDGKPLEGVCVVIGPHGCKQHSPHTDERGVFFFDVPQIPTVNYDLTFEKEGFAPVWFRIKPEAPSVYNVALPRP